MTWYAKMQDMHDVIDDALDAALAGDPPPVWSKPKVQIMPGASAFDSCPRVAIFLGEIQFDQRSCSVKKLVEYRVRLNVCVPGDPKTKEDEWETAAQKMYDLMETVLSAVTSNLEELFGTCEGAAMQPVVQLEPSGAQAGMEFGVQTS